MDEKTTHGTIAWFEMVGTLLEQAAREAALAPDVAFRFVERYTDGADLGDGRVAGLRFEIAGGRTAFQVGVRPEDLELSESGGIEMIVDLVEDLGSESYIYTHAKPDVDLVARCMGRVPAKLADTVRLRKSADGVVHLFNPDTGERIG